MRAVGYVIEVARVKTSDKKPAKTPEPTPQQRLDRYRQKRDTRTPEPSRHGVATRAATASSCSDIARRLHYDCDLEAAGVLLSWAVPMGPTLDPSARRLAVHVEDHPLDYYDFEGVIAPGEYGGGDVIVWDWGTWELARGEDALEAVAKGDLHFDLAGGATGTILLVRCEILAMDRARTGSCCTSTTMRRRGLIGIIPGRESGRTNDEVAADPDVTSTAVDLRPSG
jgi:bifunctional non-homologous end joining protein LigD